MSIESRLAENHRRVQEQIRSACVRSGRSAEDVLLVAVTKYARLEWVQELVKLGVRDLGESRPQQLLERVPAVSAEVNWHLVGHLQRNKARRVLPIVCLIHSVDTLRLLETLDRLGEELALRPRLLLEVNVSGEASKDGFHPAQLLTHWPQVLACSRVQVDGLMTMAALEGRVEDARPVFRGLRELRDRLVAQSPPAVTLPHLSMGMSRDFQIAVEEGATIVRIGSDLFEGLEGDPI